VGGLHIAGIGMDILAVERVSRLLGARGRRFAARMLSPAELAGFDAAGWPVERQAEFLAGRFAAKEAVAKAIGTGVSQLGLRRIEVSGSGRAPACRLLDQAAAIAARRGVSRVLLTITHDAGVAAAMAVALGPAGRGDEDVPASDIV